MVDSVDNAALYESLGFTQVQQQKKTSGELGLDQFLSIMTTQLQHQDPLEPMDNGEFLGQIAQFGTVTGIENLNDSFKTFSSAITNGQALQASSIVGRTVLAPTNEAYLQAGSSIDGRVELDSSAQKIDVLISDQYGQPVKTISLGARAGGNVDFSWDGTNDAGVQMLPGTYNVNVMALRGSRNEALQPEIYSQVESVSIGSGAEGLTLNLAGNGKLPYSKISAIAK
jgi:flagellar basal-body rod modification protein FlgD